MTKRRPANTFEWALGNAIACVGIDRIARGVERAVSHIYKWADADAVAKPNIMQCMMIDWECIKAGGEPEIFKVYAQWIKSAKQNQQEFERQDSDLQRQANEYASASESRQYLTM